MQIRGAVFALILILPVVARAAPPAWLAETTAGPYRVQVERVSLFETRTLESGAGAQSVQRSCSLTVRLEAASPEAMQAVAGLGVQLWARDSTGLRLNARGPALPSFSAVGGRNESRQLAVLDAPDRRATRLQSVDGELVLYRTVTPARAEFDLTVPAEGRAVAVGDARMVLQKVELSGDECTVRIRVESPAGVVISDRVESLQRAVPVLETRSGVRLRTGTFNTVGGISPQGRAYLEQKLTFRGLQEPPAKLVYDAVLKSDPDRRIAFRLTDVPLPTENPATPAPARTGVRAGLAPGTVRPGAPLPPAGDAGGAFHRIPPARAPAALAAANGGTLAGAVRGIPSQGGSVAFGLARWEGEGWSAVRWVEALVDAGGTARVAGLRPGRYRVLRSFTPAGAPAPMAGAWRNGTAVVTVVAGKEVPLPPLECQTR